MSSKDSDSDSSCSSELLQMTPDDQLCAEAKEALASGLMPASTERYQKEKNALIAYLRKQNIDPTQRASFDEITLTNYFASVILKTYKPSTAWTTFSALNHFLKTEFSLDLHHYPRLKMMLGKKSKTHKSKKALAFTKEEFERGLAAMSNDDPLLLQQKVVAVHCVGGFLRAEDALRLTVDMIEKQDTYLVINHTNPCKTNQEVHKYFLLPTDNPLTCPVTITNLYQAQCLFTKERRFFKNWNKLKQKYIQSMGKNSIGKAAKAVAQAAGLPNWQKFTTHSFRRTAATICANAPGLAMKDMQTVGRWKSASVAEGYIEKSDATALRVAKGMQMVNEPLVKRPRVAATYAFENCQFYNCFNNQKDSDDSDHDEKEQEK